MMAKKILILFIMSLLIINLVALIIIIMPLEKVEKVGVNLESDSANNEERITINNIVSNIISKKTEQKLEEDDFNERIFITGRHVENENEKLPDWIKINSSEPTDKWMNFYGNLIISGKEAEMGDRIGVFDSASVLCGVFVVKEKGKYGFLHVYGDDLLTDKDEGAVENEELNFRIYDASENKESRGYVDNNVKPIWNSYEKMRVDLSS